jgi:tetraacyldisaccharide 4'-kinase
MKPILRILSLFYQAGCQVKNGLYRINVLRAKKAPLPVVSVGNITFGGSEKTPFVMALVEALIKNDVKPAVVTRGYKGKWERRGGVLSDGRQRSGTWVESGDEPFMVSTNYPEIGVFVGRNRLRSCQKAFAMGFEVAILDDGFQHRRLARDIDLVLFDPSKKLPLREPLSSIKRADMLLLKKGADAKKAQSVLDKMQEVDIFSYSVSNEGFYHLDRKEESASNIRDKRALAFCGIARPERFRMLLEQAEIKPVHFIAFPDHFPYMPSSVEQLVKAFNSQKADICITTEKDALKVKDSQALRDIPTYYLKIGIQTEEKFFEEVLSLIKRRGLKNA